MTAHPFDDAVLDEQIAIAAEDPDTAHDLGVFEVATMDRANRVVWRIGQLRSQLAEVKRLYSSERERLDAWLDDEQRRINGQVQFLQGLVEHYHRRLLAEDKRRKTVSLPAGKLEARKARDHWEIDDAEFVAWAEANGRGDLLNRPAPKPDRNAVKKALLPAPEQLDDDSAVAAIDPATGQLVPAVRVHVADEDDLDFSVRTPGGER